MTPRRNSDPLVVVVTGATSGVGRAIAHRFASRGASVALLARGEEGLASTADEVDEMGGWAFPIATDVAEAAQVDRAAEQVVDRLGPIDLWVNNAMTTVFSFFDEVEPEEFERATRVTYLGFVWGTRAALRHMGERDRGSIIQVGSALAYRGIPLQSAYCGAKHAINGFTESVRTELIHRGSNIHIGMVNLPAVNTPQFSHCRSKFERHPMPVPPVYQPEVAAEAVEFAFRKRRRVVDVGYPTFLTRVATKAVPGFLDEYLGRSGVSSQLDDRPPEEGNEKGNLFEPIGDAGTHGIFDSRSRATSPALWFTKHRKKLIGGAAAATVAGWALGRVNPRS